MSHVSQRLMQLLEKQTGKSFADLDPATEFEAMGIDSFDFIELLFLIEDEFGVEIDYRANDVASRLKRVGDVVAIVEERVAAKDEGMMMGALPVAAS